MRRRDSGTAASMDSLLDTMTNVVGILVILLVVTQLSVSSAVKRIRSSLPEVSMEELQALEVANEQGRQRLEQLRTDWNPLQADAEKNAREIETVTQSINALQAKLKGRQAAGGSEKTIQDLNASIATSDKAAKEVTTRIAALKKESSELEKKLEGLGPARSLPSVVIRIPNPRPAPKGAKVMNFICKNNRIMALDEKMIEAMDRNVGQRAKRVRQKLAADTSSQKQFVYDGKKLEAYFKNQPSTVSGNRVTVYAPPWIDRTLLRVNAGNLGESVGSLRQSYSSIRRKLKELKGNNRYARFIVYPDSFGVYLIARQITESNGVPAGWRPHTNPEWTLYGHYIPDIKTKRTQDPKPAGPKSEKPELILD